MNESSFPDLSSAYAVEQLLPESLPADPLPTVNEWLNEAIRRKVQPNPNAFALATVDSDGRPSVRIVLCKSFTVVPGYLTFHTNRLSRKGRAIAANPRAAACFHWDTLDRQVRIEGPVTLAPDAESDAYFRTRPLERRIGAWASDQSQPISSRDALIEKVAEAMLRLGVQLDDPDAEVPRPPHWGGLRLWAEAVELWVGGQGRIHDRARWERTLKPSEAGFLPGPWHATRLQP